MSRVWVPGCLGSAKGVAPPPKGSEDHRVVLGARTTENSLAKISKWATAGPRGLPLLWPDMPHGGGGVGGEAKGNRDRMTQERNS